MPIVDEEIKSQLQAEGLLADRTLPDDQATTLSTKLYNAFLAYRKKYDGAVNARFPLLKAYNLGQGAEKEKPSDIIECLMSRTIHPQKVFNPKYPTEQKGRKNVKAAAEGLILRYFGVDVTTRDEQKKPIAHVDVVSEHGRGALFKSVTASNSMAQGYATKTAVPNFCWPMYSALLKMARSEAVKYANPGPDGKFRPGFMGDPDELQLIIVNPEENPTGTLYSEDYMDGLMEWLEDVNEKRLTEGKQPIFLAIDSPYFGARQANLDANIEKGEHYYGTSPIKKLIMEAKYTPVSASVPGTKFWATAEFGFSMIISNQRAQNMLKGVLKATNGLSGVDPMLEIMAEFLSPEHDKERLAFEAQLRAKYATNRKTLQRGLSHIEGVNIYAGDAGLTSLLEIGLDDFFGKTIHGTVTGAYEIHDMTDIVEFLFLNYGIVTVNNGTENDKGYLRIANAELTLAYSQAIPQLAQGLEAITAAQYTLQSTLGHGGGHHDGNLYHDAFNIA